MASGEIASSDFLTSKEQDGLLGEWAFFGQVKSEMTRATRGNVPGCLAYIALAELPRLVERTGLRGEAEVREAVAAMLTAMLRPLDLAGYDGRGRFLLLLPNTEADAAHYLLARLSERIAGRAFVVRGQDERFTPRVGFATFSTATSMDGLRLQAQQALEQAAAGLQNTPILYDAAQPIIVPQSANRRKPIRLPRLLNAVAKPFEEPLTDIAYSARESWEQFQTHPLARGWRRVSTALQSPIAVIARSVGAITPQPLAVAAGGAFASLRERRTIAACVRLYLALLLLLFVCDGAVRLNLTFGGYLLIAPILFAATLVWTAILQGAEAGAGVRRGLERLAERNAAARERLRGGVLSWNKFADEWEREEERVKRGGDVGCLALLRLDALAAVRERLGQESETELLRQIKLLMLPPSRPLDLIGRGPDSGLALLLPETNGLAAGQWLEEIMARLRETDFSIAGELIKLAPAVGFAPFDGRAGSEAVEQARVALQYAVGRPGDDPAAYDPLMEAMDEAPARRRRATPEKWLLRLRLPLLGLASGLAGTIIPVLLLASIDATPIDPAPIVGILLTLVLVADLLLFVLAGAYRRREAQSATEPESYPQASAIIAASLPEDGPVLVATVEAFLAVEYPAPRSLILAYSAENERDAAPILSEITARHRRLKLIRGAAGTTRDELLALALGVARGGMIGVFGADHHPAPDNFRLAWARLADGADAVVGHTWGRNTAGPLSALGVVDAEAEYATELAPGSRADLASRRLANCYWKAEALHRALAERSGDQEGSTPASGYKIAAAPELTASSLAPIGLLDFWARQRETMHDRMRYVAPHEGSPLQQARHLRSVTWGKIFPWLAGLLLPLALFILWRGAANGWQPSLWPLLLPLAVLLLSGAVQAGAAYRNAAPEPRRNHMAFLLYPFAYLLFLVGLKHLAARVEQIDGIVSPDGTIRE